MTILTNSKEILKPGRYDASEEDPLAIVYAIHKRVVNCEKQMLANREYLNAMKIEIEMLDGLIKKMETRLAALETRESN